MSEIQTLERPDFGQVRTSGFRKFTLHTVNVIIPNWFSIWTADFGWSHIAEILMSEIGTHAIFCAILVQKSKQYFL